MVSKSTVIQDVFKAFYDRLKNDVSSVTLSDSSTRTIQNYTSTYPDIEKTSKSDYPLIIVNSPELEWNEFTLGKKRIFGTITIEIVTTKKEAGDLFMDAINESLETYRDSFRDEGLFMINISDMDYSFFSRGKIKLHVKTVTFEWQFIFDKTKTY